jgi:hypothetical protein
MVDEENTERERVVEEVSITESAVRQRIVVPSAWGTASLVASAMRGSLLLYSFADMPHLLSWQLPDDEDVVLEIVADDDPRATEHLAAAEEEREDDEDDEDDEDEVGQITTWLLPDDIDEERLRYPAAWGRPSPILDAWVDGGPILLSFGDGEHVVRWELPEDMLLSLIADDTLAG